MPVTSRGVRNNNPGNIDHQDSNKWQGELPVDKKLETRFARFDTPESGIRALAKLLINYRPKTGMPGVGGPGIDTVREIIQRWAPPGENDTGAYVNAVAKAVGKRADDIIDIRRREHLIPIVTAIILHENGYNPYSQEVIAAGAERALLS